MSRRKGYVAYRQRIAAENAAARTRKPDKDRRPRFSPEKQAEAEAELERLLGKVETG